MIKPTVGRVVHFFPATTDPLHRNDEPLAATIVRVWSSTCVNLALFDGDGHLHRRSSVLLHQEENERPDAGFAAYPAREGVTLEAKLGITTDKPLPPISHDVVLERIAEAEASAAPGLFRKKPVVITAITFDQLVAHGLATGDCAVNGMPWSFTYNGYAITHENDSCYLIPTLEGVMKMGRDDMLITGVKGEIYPCKREIFEATYEPVPAVLNNPHTGALRDLRDVASDPQAALCVKPGEPLQAARTNLSRA